MLDVAAREGRPLEVEVQVVALGDELAWVSLPGEIFVELGLAIKQDSPFPSTIIAELADGVDRLHPVASGLCPGELRGRQRPMRRGLGRAIGRRGGRAAQGAVCPIGNPEPPGHRRQAGVEGLLQDEWPCRGELERFTVCLRRRGTP